MKFSLDDQPFGRFCALVSKQYLGVLALKTRDLSVDRYYFPLLLIGENDGKLSQKELCCKLRLDKATIVKYIDYLASRDLIERNVNPLDRRGCLLSLTSKGKKALPGLKKAFARTEEIAFKGLSPKEVELLNKMLEKVSGNLSEEPSASVKLNYSTK